MEPNDQLILLVEDEENIALGIQFNLEQQGFAVKLLDRGDAVLSWLEQSEPSLIILDVMLPGISGHEVCKQIREKQIHTPILMLTALSDLPNKVHGLKLGADDYLGKPFEIEELLARVNSLLRRSQWDSKEVQTEVIKLGKINFHPKKLELSAGEKKLNLTIIETKLLSLLYAENGNPVSRATLLEKVWGMSQEVQTRTLDNFIVRLRSYFETLGGRASWIESVRGVGYKLMIPKKTKI